MPKKFAGENSKAVAARARKTAAKEAEVSKKQRELEEAYWKDEDKHIAKKQQRKEEQDRKKIQALEKKAATKALLEEELANLKKTTSKITAPSKITRAQIASQKVVTSKPEKPLVETHLTIPLEENINRLQIDGEEARSVTEAINILSTKSGEVDKHPEKRLKASYAAYEDKRLIELKEENPTLRLSQLKQMIFKEWQKSPENPLNQV